jgi:hypothetical protein
MRSAVDVILCSTKMDTTPLGHLRRAFLALCELVEEEVAARRSDAHIARLMEIAVGMQTALDGLGDDDDDEATIADEAMSLSSDDLESSDDAS